MNISWPKLTPKVFSASLKSNLTEDDLCAQISKYALPDEHVQPKLFNTLLNNSRFFKNDVATFMVTKGYKPPYMHSNYLRFAIVCDNMVLFDALIDETKSVATGKEDGECLKYPLQIAVTHNKIEMLKKLCEHPLLTKEHMQHEVLNDANTIEVLDVLVNRGYNINVKMFNNHLLFSRITNTHLFQYVFTKMDCVLVDMNALLRKLITYQYIADCVANLFFVVKNQCRTFDFYGENGTLIDVFTKEKTTLVHGPLCKQFNQLINIVNKQRATRHSLIVRETSLYPCLVKIVSEYS